MHQVVEDAIRQLTTEGEEHLDDSIFFLASHAAQKTVYVLGRQRGAGYYVIRYGMHLCPGQKELTRDCLFVTVTSSHWTVTSMNGDVYLGRQIVNGDFGNPSTGKFVLLASEIGRQCNGK